MAEAAILNCNLKDSKVRIADIKPDLLKGRYKTSRCAPTISRPFARTSVHLLALWPEGGCSGEAIGAVCSSRN